MKLRRLIRSLPLLLATVLASPAWASVTFQVSSSPTNYCPSSKDAALGTVVLVAQSTGDIPSGSSIFVSFPAPLSSTAAPAVASSPAVAGLSNSASDSGISIQFTSTVTVTAGTSITVSGLRVDATQITGTNATVFLNGSSPVSGSFSFTASTVVVGTADQTKCPATLVLSSNALTFRATPNVTLLPQTVTVTSSNSQNFSAPSVVVTTTNGGTWLSASVDGSGNSYTITITPDPTGLAGGTYTGKVSVSVANALNSPQVINVTLTVSGGKIIVDGPFLPGSNVLRFSTSVGIDPAPQQLTVSTSDPSIGLPTVTASVQTPSGGTWLIFTQTTSKDPSTNQNILVVTVTPKAAGLPASVPSPYTGSLFFTSSVASNSPVSVGIQFQVDSPPQIALSTSQLSFAVPANSTTASSQTFTLSSSGGGTLSWIASSATDRGGSWLSVNPASGTGNTVVTVTANPTGLASGVYTGTITVTSSNAGNSPQKIAVTLTVGTVPAIADRGIKNGASFSDGTAAAGTILSIFGSNLASSTQTAQTLPLPTTLGGAQVKVNGNAAPLFYASPSQINFQLPPDVTGASVSIVVSRDGVDGTPASVALTPATPGLFSLSSDGKGPGAILKSDYSLVSATNPAARGSVVLIYGSGMGPVSPPVAAGQPAPSSPLSLMTLTPTVTIGGVQARVVFAGLAPTFAGLYQINVEVPSGVSPGSAVSVVISVNNVDSNMVTLAVQ